MLRVWLNPLNLRCMRRTAGTPSSWETHLTRKEYSEHFASMSGSSHIFASCTSIFHNKVPLIDVSNRFLYQAIIHPQLRVFHRKKIQYRRGISSSTLSECLAREKLTAYCFTLDDEGFDVQGSARALQLRFATDAAVFLHEEVFYISLVRNIAIVTQRPELFVFRDGSVVLWNVPPEMEADALQLLDAFRSRKEASDLSPERETMNCAFDPSLTEVCSHPQR